jgi:iron complex outermembrane receptor protein
VDTETAQPVLTITRADIEKQGFQSVADILQNISATGAPPISRAQPLSSGENVGGTFISLRNLGAQRTLVLVNGKRLGISTSGLSDVSTIPTVSVERIEVLKDGASSIYGSDAIAGVINIITRSNYEGAAASAYYGQYDEGDGAITKGDFLMGFGGDRGSVTIGAEWTNEEEVMAADRDFSAFPRSSRHPTDAWTTVGQQGGFVDDGHHGGSGHPDRHPRDAARGRQPRNINDYRRQNTVIGTCAGATEATGCTPGSILDKSNTNLQTTLHTPLDRSSCTWMASSTSPTTSASAPTSCSPTARAAATSPVTRCRPSRSTRPMAATSFFNPTGATIANWWRRTWEQPRISDSELTTYRFTGAFEGSFEIGDRYFDWDVTTSTTPTS